MSSVEPKSVSVSDVHVFPLKTFQAEGTLVFMEHLHPVPFAVARVFCVTGVTTGATRGDHAHKECKQALVCVRGAVEVLCDDGREKRRIELTSSEKLLYVPPMIWASETYRSKDTVLLVLADQPYDNADYLRDYAEYLTLRGISS